MNDKTNDRIIKEIFDMQRMIELRYDTTSCRGQHTNELTHAVASDCAARRTLYILKLPPWSYILTC